MVTSVPFSKINATEETTFRRLAVAPDYSAASGGSLLATWSKSSVPVLCTHGTSMSTPPLFSFDSSVPWVQLPYPAIDVAWCPFKKGSSYASFLTACRSCPLQLWDVDDSSLRASYCCYNSAGAPASPLAVLWSNCRTLVAAGYGGCEDDVHVRFYDVLCEGNSVQASYRSPCSKGVVSALSDGPAPYQENMILAGFLRTGNVDIIDTRHVGVAAVLRGLRSGVAQIKPNQFAEHQVYVAGRFGDARIVCWDIRKSNEILSVFRRTLLTQQPAFFGFARPFCGGVRRTSLVSATHDGGVLVFDPTAANSEPRRVNTSLGLTAGLVVLDDDGTVAVTVGRRHYRVRNTCEASRRPCVLTPELSNKLRSTSCCAWGMSESESSDSENQEATGYVAVFGV